MGTARMRTVVTAAFTANARGKVQRRCLGLVGMRCRFQSTDDAGIGVLIATKCRRLHLGLNSSRISPATPLQDDYGRCYITSDYRAAVSRRPSRYGR